MSILNDDSIMKAAAEDFTETYERVVKDIARLRNLFGLMDAVRRGGPLKQDWNIRQAVNGLKTLERRFKEVSESAN